MTELSYTFVPVVDAKMLRGLEAFYDIASKEWKDVRGECQGIAEQIARQFGLLYVEGEFRLDAPLTVGDTKLLEPHAWNTDGDRNVIDLTGAQFNNGLYNKISAGVLVTKHGEELFRRYRPAKVVKMK